jgi:hypothetical protein
MPTCSGAKRPANSHPRVIPSHPHGAHRLLPTAAIPAIPGGSRRSAASDSPLAPLRRARRRFLVLALATLGTSRLSLVFRQRQLTDSGEHAAQHHGAFFPGSLRPTLRLALSCRNNKTQGPPAYRGAPVRPTAGTRWDAYAPPLHASEAEWRREAARRYALLLSPARDTRRFRGIAAAFAKAGSRAPPSGQTSTRDECQVVRRFAL